MRKFDECIAEPMHDGARVIFKSCTGEQVYADFNKEQTAALTEKLAQVDKVEES